MDSQLLAFTGVAAALTVTPGADTMLVVRNVVARGTQAGLLATFGVCSGLFLHATVSALGLSLILVRSATAFQLVKIAGACYLVFLGCQSLAAALRKREAGADGSEMAGATAHADDASVDPAAASMRIVADRAGNTPDRPHNADEALLQGQTESASDRRNPASAIVRSGARPFFEGLMTNALNPKVAIFYLAFLPQFVRAGDAVLPRSVLLAGIHFTLGIVWLSLLTVLLGSLHTALQRPSVRRGLEATTGAILIAFGARLALAHR